MKCLRILVLPFLMVALAACDDAPHPTDPQLLANFAKHEADFEKLLTMMRADKALQRVDDTWTRPEDPSTIGVTQERIQAYRNLFATLGIPRGFYAFHDPERFTFLANARGLGISGSGKGYAYLEEKPDLIVENLDTYRPEEGGSFTAYRPIKGKWYLYFDNED